MQGVQSGRRRLGAGFLALACALSLLASLTVAPPGAEASASGTLVVTGPSTPPSVGDTFAVTLDLDGATGINSINAYLLYNPNVVQVLDADPGTTGTQILPGPFPGGGAVTANSAAGGSIQYGYALAGGAEASGSGTIATVQFRALANGDAGLSWGTVQATDGSGSAGALSTSSPSITVGGTAAAATTIATATDTAAAPTDTATTTAVATDTPSTTTTAVPSATASATSTRTATVTRTPSSTATVRPTSTPRITVLRNSNATPTLTVNQKLGVDPASSKPQNSLPSAGNDGPGTQWWRWTFFAAALMLGIAGWFFTFAVHQTDRDVVLMDRHDRRRRRR